MSNWRWIGLVIGLVGMTNAIIDHSQFRIIIGIGIIILCGWPLLPLLGLCLQYACLAPVLGVIKLSETIGSVAAARAQRKRTEAATREVKQHQKTMRAGMSQQSLHRNINELLSFAHDLKPGGAENDLLRSAMMDVLGRLAELSVEPSSYQTPGIAADVQLFLQHLEEMGLQDDLLYKRARNVLQPGNAIVALSSRQPSRVAVR